ncbi:MAG: hypothetical protein WD844_07300 [Thermoleophilaceae bacterium]
MTPARHRAYKRALQAVDELPPGILEPAEAELLCDAAEGLLLVRDGEGAERERLLESASLTLSMLFGSERMSAAQSERLWAMLAACGPQPLHPRARRHPSLIAG